MKRRKFIAGVGGASLGASALVGSGAFSRIESQRRVKIEVAKDPHAYLGLDGCHVDGEPTPNSSYTNVDDSGHLEVDMTEDDAIGDSSDPSFDNVFQICNQGKTEICVWIGDENWPSYEDEPRVDFYIADNRAESILGSENAYPIAVGECICLGIEAVPDGLDEGDHILEDIGDEIVIHADEACPEDVPGEARGETAWALKRDTEAKDNTLNGLQNINRWGWYVPYEGSDGDGAAPIEADLIAGAGRNDLDAGEDVADVDISDDGETLSIDIEMDEEWTLESSEVFAGTLGGLEDTRGAPGQFPFSSNDFETDSYEIPLADIDGDLEVIAIHADVTTEE